MNYAWKSWQQHRPAPPGLPGEQIAGVRMRYSVCFRSPASNLIVQSHELIVDVVIVPNFNRGTTGRARPGDFQLFGDRIQAVEQVDPLIVLYQRSNRPLAGCRQYREDTAVLVEHDRPTGALDEVERAVSGYNDASIPAAVAGLRLPRKRVCMAVEYKLLAMRRTRNFQPRGYRYAGHVEGVDAGLIEFIGGCEPTDRVTGSIERIEHDRWERAAYRRACRKDRTRTRFRAYRPNGCRHRSGEPGR